MGLVVFAGYAELAVPPTTDRSALDRALNNLSTSPGTAIGAAILKSLDAIAEVDPQVQPVGNAVSSAALAPSTSPEGTGAAGAATLAQALWRNPQGRHVPDIIVLLTDGANNRGITPLQAVPYAVARRVRIYTDRLWYHPYRSVQVLTTATGWLCFNGGFGPNGGYGGGGYGGGPYGGGGFGIPGGAHR